MSSGKTEVKQGNFVCTGFLFVVELYFLFKTEYAKQTLKRFEKCYGTFTFSTSLVRSVNVQNDFCSFKSEIVTGDTALPGTTVIVPFNALFASGSSQ